MKLNPSDPDIETIVARIQREDIKLQPDFQRGEVWSLSKKQKLIDSILREWHVPPIHLILVKESSKQEVLDGQQRLVSIRDFVKNQFEVDGEIEPKDDRILRLHGKKFDELPEDVKGRFNQFTIRVFRITDYAPQEPGELFYRLNQQVNMTSAEQRNAFFGPVREQVKLLVKFMGDKGVNHEFIGFTNSRMAYDDVVSRLLLAIESGTLAEKITSPLLAERYRNETPFTENATEEARRSIELLGDSRAYLGSKLRFNKATLFSWLYFLAKAKYASPAMADAKVVGKFIESFESSRENIRLLETKSSPPHFKLNGFEVANRFIQQVLEVYNDRSTSRVSDISSVVSRDIAIWTMFIAYMTAESQIFDFNQESIKLILATLEEVSKEDAVGNGNCFMDKTVSQLLGNQE